LGEGGPTKQTSEVVEKIANAIAPGLADDEAASIAGISDLTLTKWRREAVPRRPFKQYPEESLCRRFISKYRSDSPWASHRSWQDYLGLFLTSAKAFLSAPLAWAMAARAAVVCIQTVGSAELSTLALLQNGAF
jgi:hypothetical protein